MTLSDLENLNGHFTLNFHYYEPRFQPLGYTHIAESVYAREQRRWEEADRDPQNIWNPRKKMRIFHRRYIVGTLTNKAIISMYLVLHSP